jgi:F-type H+-transporting ATPase subunit a
MSSIHISIAAEKIYEVNGFQITNAMLGSSAVLAIMFIMGIIIQFNLKQYGMPTKIQLIVESFYEFLEDIAHQSLGEHKTRKYLGLVIILFLYIVIGSWIGLLPGVIHFGINEKDIIVPFFRAPTTDLNATTALSIVAFLAIQYSGISSLGFGTYVGKFINFKNGLGGLILGLFEILQEFVRLISFSFRLFGNIFAGEVLLVVILSLTKFNDSNNPGSLINFLGVPAPSLVVLMEFFVALIQAYVFVNLMSVFITMAADNHNEHQTNGELYKPN